MKTETLRLLACPECGSDLAAQELIGVDEVDSGVLACGTGHTFPVVGGIPRFLAGDASQDASAIHDSFSSEWSQHDYITDRVWGQTLEVRRDIALRELACEPADLQGKLILDAGCGAGILTYLLTEMGARVVAADISRSIDTARRQLTRLGVEKVDFVQADLTRPPLRPGTFVFSGAPGLDVAR